MITIFNRAEVLVTYDMARQAAVRSALGQNLIDYRVKVVNRNSGSYGMDAGMRARVGTMGEKPQYEYIIYVKKEDKGKAAHIIRELS